MKRISAFNPVKLTAAVAFVVLLSAPSDTNAQICANPAGVIYGLTGTGAIYPINVSNASLGTIVKNTTYSGNSVSKANGLAYNNSNGKFYYFKRNVGSSSPVEFVSYDPATLTVTVLASTTCAAEVHTGCITADGTGYYTIDTDANLNYYNIITNTWTFITSVFSDQNGNDVSNVINTQDAGDIAFDGNNNLWIVTSNSTNYGLYRLSGSLPTTPVAGLSVNRRISPTAATPTNKSIAGIAFSSTGQIFMATKNDNRLYRLENNLSLTFLGTFSVSDVGNDLTSCSFPLAVLPVKWLSYSTSLVNNNRIDLNWEVTEQDNAAFTVQYSNDGTGWKDLASVQSNSIESGSGKYSYIHLNPAAGRNYYRIMLTDISGKYSYSETKVVAIKTNGTSVTVWPNPANDFISITGAAINSGSQLKVSVFDLAGKKQLDKQLRAGENSITVNSLKTGIYIINIVAADGTMSTQKFVKQ